jgi:hypothetical protein
LKAGSALLMTVLLIHGGGDEPLPGAQHDNKSSSLLRLTNTMLSQKFDSFLTI